MKNFAIKLLGLLAKAVLKKYQPKVVAITGTVGKSSTKQAAYAVLCHSLVARASEGSYNNELGVPLSILGLKAPGRSIWRWLLAFAKGAKLLIFTDHTYPDVLVLEFGADKSGDIAKLTEIAPPAIAVLTAITPVHLQKFGNMEEVQKEKAKIWSRGKLMAIGNIDDELVKKEISKQKNKIITFGFSEEATCRAEDAGIYTGTGVEIYEKIKGTAFKLYGDGSVLPVHLSGVLGTSHVYAALSGAAVGAAFGLNYHDIVEGLHSYKPLPGRMRLLPGIKRTLLIDDTYNSSPAAAASALVELRKVTIEGGARKIAILGDMLELGAESDNLHQELGRKVAQNGIDILIGVGERAANICAGAKEAGMAESNIFHFGPVLEAGKFVQEIMKRGDIVLIKGSRGVHLEKAVKELMAEPLREEELLVR